MIQVQLQPEIEAQLAAEAHAHGLTLDRYIEKIVEARTSIEASKHLLDLAATVEEDEAIGRGLEDLHAGRTQPLNRAFDEIRLTHDIPR